MLPYHREVVVFHLILDSLQISFFSHYPDDVSLLEDSGRGYVRQILATFFQSYNHAVVPVSDTAFDERLAQEFAGRRDDEMVSSGQVLRLDSRSGMLRLRSVCRILALRSFCFLMKVVYRLS